MPNETLELPSPLDKALRRARRDYDSPKEQCEAWQLAAECTLKYVTAVLHAALTDLDQGSAARIGVEVLRATSLGGWNQALRSLTRELRRHHVDREILTLLNSIERRRTSADDEPVTSAARRLLAAIDAEDFPTAQNWLSILDQLTLFRNKTRGHGAHPAVWYAEVVDDVSTIVEQLVHMVAQPRIAFVSRTEGVSRPFVLLGGGSLQISLSHEMVSSGSALIALDSGSSTRVGGESVLFWPDVDYDRYYFVNGAVDSRNTVEIINYFDGGTKRVAIPSSALQVAGRPRSETSGDSELDWGGATPHNLPTSIEYWVDRPALEKRLREVLLKPQYPVVTLHGIGGTGKTSLALKVCRDLADGQDSRFDVILWFSARDTDLTPLGPKATMRDVRDLSELAREFSRVTECIDGVQDPIETFRSKLKGDGLAHLIVLDNFETLDDPLVVQRFISDHVLAPNKVLITTRLRPDESDFPLDVYGLERSQADDLLITEARARYAEGLVSPALRDRLFSVTSGVPYALKLAVAQIARGRHPNEVVSELQRDQQLLDVLFRRSYEYLSVDAKRLVLLLGTLKSSVPELYLRVLFALDGSDFASAEDEARRQALITRVSDVAGEYSYSIPSVARGFVRSEFHVSELALKVEGDRRTIIDLSPSAVKSPRDRALVLASGLLQRIDSATSRQSRDQLIAILEELARLHPETWEHVAKTRAAIGDSHDRAMAAYRQGLSVDPTQLRLWEAWIVSEAGAGNWTQALTLVEQALLACGHDCVSAVALGATAIDLVSRPEFRQSTASKRSVFEALDGVLATHGGSLDGDGRAIFAWVKLHLGDQVAALGIVEVGLKLEPLNRHLTGIYNTLRENHPGLFR